MHNCGWDELFDQKTGVTVYQKSEVNGSIVSTKPAAVQKFDREQFYWYLLRSKSVLAREFHPLHGDKDAKEGAQQGVNEGVNEGVNGGGSALVPSSGKASCFIWPMYHRTVLTFSGLQCFFQQHGTTLNGDAGATSVPSSVWQEYLDPRVKSFLYFHPHHRITQWHRPKSVTKQVNEQAWASQL